MDTSVENACAVAAAGAHDLNDQLTIILSGIVLALQCLEPGHPARPVLLDARSAVQCCAWKTSALLDYSARRSAGLTAETLDQVIERTGGGE